MDAIASWGEWMGEVDTRHLVNVGDHCPECPSDAQYESILRDALGYDESGDEIVGLVECPQCGWLGQS